MIPTGKQESYSLHTEKNLTNALHFCYQRVNIHNAYTIDIFRDIELSIIAQ